MLRVPTGGGEFNVIQGLNHACTTSPLLGCSSPIKQGSFNCLLSTPAPCVCRTTEGGNKLLSSLHETGNQSVVGYYWTP